MLKVGIMTETLYKRVGIRRGLATIKKLGFDVADITFQREKRAKEMIRYFKGKDYKKKAKELKEYADKLKLPLVQAHAPFPSNITGNERYNKAVFKKLVRTIEVCGILKIKHVVIHPLKDHSVKDNIAFYKKLLPYAKKANVIICTENMWGWVDDKHTKIRPSMCSFSDTFNAIIDGVNDKHLKGCLDIGHAEMFRFMNYSARKLIEEMGNRVVCLHIHDNDLYKDRHWIPFRGSIDFKDVAKGLKKINYKGDLVLEISAPENVDSDSFTFQDGIKYLSEAYRAAKKFQSMIKE